MQAHHTNVLKVVNPLSKKDQVVEKFRSLFSSRPLVVKSPGRINLIGEHIDYNGGSVLPAAIDKNIYVAAQAGDGNTIRIFAPDYNDLYETSISNIHPTSKTWVNYPLGVIYELKKMGADLSGIHMVVGGDLPPGAGLSSSAATTCATAFALNEVFSLGLSRLEIAQVAQRAEQNFAGVECGLMDQFASVFGKKDHVVKLNCRTNQHDYVPFYLEDVRIVLFDTEVKHQLASSDYNLRRRECKEGLDMLKLNCSDIIDLADVTEEMLVKFVKPQNPVLYKRCLYVVQEMERVKKACLAINRNDFASLGQLMFDTHTGLSQLYEVSCTECDFLVDLARQHSGILGARMMGGGFGGCTINLIESARLEETIRLVRTKYKDRFGKSPNIYQVRITNGTQLIDIEEASI